MPEHALDLAIYVFHLIGQQPGQTEVLAFLVGEAVPLLSAGSSNSAMPFG